MGKRKERRIAAMMAANRRVKLDLFAQPSDELVDGSNNGVGEEHEPDHHIGVPKSPSSSGKQTDNPLSLLGQYSDGELDEEENEKPDGGSSAENCSDLADQEHKEVLGSRINNSRSLSEAPADVKASLNLAGEEDSGDACGNETCVVSSSSVGADAVLSTNSYSSTAVIAIEDDSVWKAILDEQSALWYYWNTETGETSWEIPDALIKSGLLAPQVQVSTPGKRSTSSDGNESPLNASGGEQDVEVTELKSTDQGHVSHDEGNWKIERELEVPGTDEEASERCEEVAPRSDDIRQTTAGGTMGLENNLHSGTSSIGAPHDSETNTPEDDNDGYPSGRAASMRNEIEEEEKLVDAVQLIHYCQRLLQKLSMLERNDATSEGRNSRSKYLLEVELRLSDCKALSPFGTSLLPFWLHMDSRLKELESLIDRDEAVLHDKLGSKVLNSPDVPPINIQGDLQEVEVKEPETDSQEKLAADVARFAEPNKDIDMVDDGILEINQSGPSGKVDPRGDLEEGELDDSEELSAAVQVPEFSKVDKETCQWSNGLAAADNVPYNEEDMDVDMELDDENSGHRIANPESTANIYQVADEDTFVPTNAQFANSQSILGASTLAYVDEVGVPPPPPEEDWVPPPPPDSDPIPPPPDSDLIPPPPADDPSVLHDYAHPETMYPNLSYSQLYTFMYNVPGVDYYATGTPEVIDSSFYNQSTGSHILEAQPLGYEAAINSAGEATTLTSNHVEAAVYYEVPGATVPSLPVVTSSDSCSYFDGSVTFSYIGDGGPSQLVSVGATEAASSSRPGVELNNLSVESETATTYEPVIPPFIASSTTTTSSDTTVVSSTTADKNTSKVVRSKKRPTPVATSLRSNKKVSSMVDKWKAAKEELHAHEQEKMESAYDMFERKRQKEIEEWKAKQIASGEARANANFQPLGCDWRERVRRRKAERGVDVEHSQSEQATEEKQQPDLTELSKTLPSGWQVYWDETSKQVYYANSLTSETTWTRPTA